MSASAGASSSSGDGNYRYFSGDSEDAKEYKRWKTWATNKLLTLGDKVPETARGAYIYTLLSGKALECCEHLDPSTYQVKGGESVLFKQLDSRFPQKDASDELSETLTEVFSVRAVEGESLKTWISRASELFDRCKRKCNVEFPEEARGWLILHRSTLTDEQKAIVLARSLGSLKREQIGTAMRSCYPDFIVSRKRATGVNLVEDDIGLDNDVDWQSPVDDPVFHEVEQFLAEHDQAAISEDEVYEESEVAEALAVTWKEKRKELASLIRQTTCEGRSRSRWKS